MGDASGDPARERRRWVRWVLGFAFFALAMAGISFLTLSSWSELRRATPEEAAAAFAAARAAAGGGPAYIAIDPDGTVHVRRELEGEGEEPAELAALHLHAWDPASGRLVHVRFPFWFVRLKLSRTLNLGTFTTFLAGDWEHLELEVTEDDLARRGPGLVLDHETAGGARILLRSE